jgi:hypothetical protein
MILYVNHFLGTFAMQFRFSVSFLILLKWNVNYCTHAHHVPAACPLKSPDDAYFGLSRRTSCVFRITLNAIFHGLSPGIPGLNGHFHKAKCAPVLAKSCREGLWRSSDGWKRVPKKECLSHGNWHALQYPGLRCWANVPQKSANR